MTVIELPTEATLGFTSLNFDGEHLIDVDAFTDTGPGSHAWLNEDVRVTKRMLAETLLDGRGNRTFRYPAALTKGAFVQRKEFGSDVRWRDVKSRQEQFMLSTAVVRLAHERGCPVVLLSLAAPHRLEWKLSRTDWSAILQEWRRSSTNITEEVGAAIQLRFAEWSASFQNGTNRGYHVLLVLDSELTESQVQWVKHELCDLWVRLVRRQMDKSNPPEDLDLDPERCAVATDFVDEDGRPYTDTSYFFKDRNIHGGGGPRGARRQPRRQGRWGAKGIKDLEQMVKEGEWDAVELLADLKQDMHRVERMSLMDRRWEGIAFEFRDTLNELAAERREHPVVVRRIIPVVRRLAAWVRGGVQGIQGRPSGWRAVRDESPGGNVMHPGDEQHLGWHGEEQDDRTGEGPRTQRSDQDVQRRDVERGNLGGMYSEWNRGRTKYARGGSIEPDGNQRANDGVGMPVMARSQSIDASFERRRYLKWPIERPRGPRGAPLRVSRYDDTFETLNGAQGRSLDNGLDDELRAA